MQTIKSGRDFTGYAIRTHKACGHTTRIALPNAGNCYDLETSDVAARGLTFTAGKEYARRPSGRIFVHVNDVQAICECGAVLPVSTFSAIFGRYVEEIVCNDKCMGATRDACDCSCGGKNHGGKHSA